MPPIPAPAAPSPAPGTARVFLRNKLPGSTPTSFSRNGAGGSGNNSGQSSPADKSFQSCLYKDNHLDEETGSPVYLSGISYCQMFKFRKANIAIYSMNANSFRKKILWTTYARKLSSGNRIRRLWTLASIIPQIMHSIKSMFLQSYAPHTILFRIFASKSCRTYGKESHSRNHFMATRVHKKH